MTHRDTQTAWDIESEEFVTIGRRTEWEMTGRDEKRRPIWIPKAGDPDKADRGRKHYCCSDMHVPLRVNQGAVNKWSFSSVRSGSSLSSCNLQQRLGEFRNARGEGPRHKKAKYILAHFLQSRPGKAEFNVKDGFNVIREGIEKKIPGESVIPDITIEHDDGRPDTYVEIVVTSAPHQNSNAWPFYEDRQKQLIVVDVMDNEEGWHYRKERIYEILVAKFRRYFNDPERTNAPKTWDDRVSSHIPISGILRRWTEAHLDEVERQAQRRQEQEQEALDDKKRAKQEAEYKSTIKKARQEYTEKQNEIRSERENRLEILNRATETTQKYYKTNPQTEDTKELIASYKLDTIRIKSWIDFKHDFLHTLGEWASVIIEDKEAIDRAREFYQSGGQSISASIRGEITSSEIILDHDLIEDLVSDAEDEVNILTEAFEKREEDRKTQAEQAAVNANLKAMQDRQNKALAATKRREERRDFGDKATEVTNLCQAITNAASRYKFLKTYHSTLNYQALSQVTTVYDQAFRDIKIAVGHSPTPHYVTVRNEVDRLIIEIDQINNAPKEAMDYIYSQRTELDALEKPLRESEEAASEHRLPNLYWEIDYPDRESDLNTRLAGLSKHTDTITDVNNYLEAWEAGYTDLTEWKLFYGKIGTHGDSLIRMITKKRNNAVRLCDGRLVGILKFFNSKDGYGFIQPNDRSLEDHYFHESSIVANKPEIRSSHSSRFYEVIFTSSRGKKGPVAKRVQLKPDDWDDHV